MNPEFNFTEQEIRNKGVETACREAYERGRREGVCPGAVGAAFAAGMFAGAMETHEAVDLASTVKNVYRNGNNTVLEFADGSKTRVTYDSGYGYAYDDEKAIMAAMLKRLTGNGYIKALKAFARRTEEPVPVDCTGSKNNVSRDMIVRTDPDVDRYFDKPTTDPVSQALADMRRDDPDLWEDFQEMPDEPGRVPSDTTDPVSVAMARAEDAAATPEDYGYCLPEDEHQPPDEAPADKGSTDPVTAALESCGTAGAAS